MPKTKRDRLKGSIATAYLDLDRAVTQIAEVGIEFDPVHPDLALGLHICVNLIDEAQLLLQMFYQGAWGDVPANWEATRDRK